MQNLNFTVADLLHIFADEVRKITRAEIQAALIAAKNEPKKMYSRTEACKVLHVTVPTLWRWEKEGLIKGQRAGRRVLFSTEEINRLIHEKGGNV
jgi:excisionase family DNA binding protein